MHYAISEFILLNEQFTMSAWLRFLILCHSKFFYQKTHKFGTFSRTFQTKLFCVLESALNLE